MFHYLVFIGLLFFIFTGFLLSRVLRRNDIADTLWGIGFVLLAFLQFVGESPQGFRASFTLGLVSLWGLRLAVHLGLRFAKSTHEDPRYANWRKEWGSKEPLFAFTKVFLLQGIVLLIVVSPALILIQSQEAQPFGPWEFVGLTLFLLGIALETVADLELMSFKKSKDSLPTGSKEIGPLNTGLWKRSRHPNYFGEILVWSGIALMAQSLEFGRWTFISPLLIGFLLIKVSGVPMLEKILVQRGEAYRKYFESTPSLFPFQRNDVLVFFAICISLVCMDLIWLHFIFGNFYRSQAALVGRIQGDQWDLILWAALLVYVSLALGLQALAVSKQKTQSFFRGAIFGLSSYGIYEYTNLAMIKNWPLDMAALDILWGVVLCSMAALVGSVVGSMVGSVFDSKVDSKVDSSREGSI